jgi:hypothetical protein
MKRLLLYPFIILYNIIKRNIGKTIWVSLAIIGFHFSQNYLEDIHSTKTADFVIKSGTDYVYFFSKSQDGDYSSMTTKTPLKNNTYSYTETQGSYIFFQILSWGSVVILVICFIVGISGDDTAAWEFDECFEESLSFLISCEIEGDKFYYMALGRLLLKSDRQLNSSYHNITRELSIRNFNDILNCPKFKTRSQKRGELLDKLV